MALISLASNPSAYRQPTQKTMGTPPSLEAPLFSDVSRDFISASTANLHLLTNEPEGEVLSFLSARPLHTVIMASFIRENGFVSAFNRGKFYCHRNQQSQIDGVALIGHVTLFEAQSQAAIAAFSHLASQCAMVRVLAGEQQKVEVFWRHFCSSATMGCEIRRELLLVQHSSPVESRARVDSSGATTGLRTARPEDLHLVMTTHARMAVEDCGMQDPIAVDARGFAQRCARRIDQGKTWIMLENGSLLFKADVVSETPEAAYLEGVYVHPGRRGHGYGFHCLTELTRKLLTRSRSICLLVSEEHDSAQAFYRRAGFTMDSRYTTVFLNN